MRWEVGAGEGWIAILSGGSCGSPFFSGKLTTCYYFCYCFQAVGQRNLVAAEARVKGELEKRQREIQELQNQAKFHMAHAQGLQETLNKQQQQQQQVR